MTAPPDARTSLARCVGDVDAFLEQHWGRSAHLHRGPDAADVLSLGDVDHLLSATALRLPAFRLVQAGRTLPTGSYTRRARVGSRDITDLVDVAAVLRLFTDGATVVLQGLHRYWPPVTALCRDIEHVLTHPVQANAYITPPGSQGLRVHGDAHDVLALQTAGRKQWVVYDDGDTATMDATLEPGDCLYLPQGVRHAARTVDESSIHLTLGIRRVTWASALRPAVDAALSAEPFAAALPAGFAADPAAQSAAAAERLRQLANQIEKADPAELLQSAADRFWSTRTPPLEGQLSLLLALDEISDDSVLARRPHTPARLLRDGDRVVLALADRELRLPAAVEPALRRVVASERLRVAELADVLDDSSRLVLARRLVREGLVVVDGG